MNDEIFWKYPDAIVSCEWLNKNLNNPDIRIYDCTTYLQLLVFTVLHLKII